jgi:hypothetical protein
MKSQAARIVSDRSRAPHSGGIADAQPLVLPKRNMGWRKHPMNTKRLYAIFLLTLLLPATYSPLLAGTVCQCEPTQTYGCGTSGFPSCAAAQSFFQNQCVDYWVNRDCPYGVCSVGSSSSCYQNPQYPNLFFASGTVTYSCYSCIDYPD